MGLTCHYQFSFKGTKRELLAILRKLREKFKTLPVGSVGEVLDLKRAHFEMGWGKYKGILQEEHRLGFMMSCMREFFVSKYPEESDEAWKERIAAIKKSGNGVGFHVGVDEGCEPFTVILARYGNSDVWQGWGFTKTQYAAHFVDAHLAVVKMLDLCKEAGILASASDEGEFYETRDLAVLAKNINASTDLIRSITAGMDALGKKHGLIMAAPVKETANYMVVKDGKGKRETRHQSRC
jgi:hypothetical protein